MDALGLAQPPMRTTHIGGQDSSRQQLLIVDRNTLACVTNTQLILYKIGSFPPKCEADLLTPSNAPCLRDPYVLHSSNTFEDDGGISTVAIDNDHELIAVCGRSIGKPANIYIYSSSTFELVQLCKAFAERGFSAAAFRGKFALTGNDVGISMGGSNPETRDANREFEISDKNAASGETLQASKGQETCRESTVMRSSTLKLKIEETSNENMAKNELVDPEQVPLLAVVGWEGDEGEVASLSTSYLTLWNVSTASAFLRLNTPALQVLDLQWSPFFAYQLTTSGSRHIRLWTAVQTFTGLKLKGRTCRFGQLSVSDIRSFVEITEQMLLSGSDSGNLLLWEDGDIKAEMLELLPGALNPYRRSSLTSRDRMDEVSSQRGPSVTARSRNNLRSSMRSGRKSSSAVVSDASNGQDGVHDATEPPIKHLPSCHRGAVNTVFRDPRNASHVVSAGNDGQMKWWDIQAILEGVNDMAEETKIAVPLIKSFAMPEYAPIKKVLPHPDTSSPFWLVVADCGTTWLFCPQLDSLVKVLDFHAGSILMAMEVADEFADARADLLTIGDDGSARTWKSPPCHMPLTCRRYSSCIRCVALMPETKVARSSCALLGFSDGVVRMSEFSKNGSQLVLAVKTHACAVEHLAVDPTSQLLAVVGEDGLVLLLKLQLSYQMEREKNKNGDMATLNGVGRSWQVEPLGFTKTPSTLTKLIWEHPLLLLGVATDAALLVLTGLDKLTAQAGCERALQGGDTGLAGEKKNTTTAEKMISTKEHRNRREADNRRSDSSSQVEPLEEANHLNGETPRNIARRPSEKAASPAAGDPLDLTQVLFFRRIELKISAAALRSLVPEGEDSPDQEEFSGSDSESELACEREPDFRAITNQNRNMMNSSSGSLEEQAAAADETRRVLAATMKQQQRRRAAAAAAAAATARLTAITTSCMQCCTDATDLLTWKISSNKTGRNVASPYADNERWTADNAFLLFSGTSNMRNGIWCTPIHTLLDSAGSPTSFASSATNTAVRPLISLYNALQQPTKTKYNAYEFLGPHLTQLVALPEEGLLVAGTSDGRVLLFPADTVKACAVARVFDSHVGVVTNILLRPVQRTKQWAIVAAAQNGAWWRCEFDLESVCLLCKNSQDYEKELEIAKAEKAKAERVEAQQALRSGPAQQQAEKHQQQQQFLRRLLMPDATLCDDEVDAEATAASRGTSAKKTTEPKMPCPLLVPLGISDMPDTNDITSGSAEIAEAEHSNTLDAIQDIMGSQEPTIMEKRRLQRQEEADFEAQALKQQEQSRLQDITQRFQSLVTRAKNLPRVNTQEMLMELVIRGDLLQIDEFEAAKSIRTVERKIESAREQHQALINTLTRLFDGALETFAAAGILENLCVYSFPTNQTPLDNQQLQTAEEAQSTSQGAKNIQTVLEAAREQELRRLLLPELPILSQTPSSSRRPTADSEALKAVKVQGMQIPTICNGPGTLVALSLQPESSIKAAGTMPWSDARRRRVEEMAILLKAQPKEDFTDPRDECRIAETIKSLNAYNLTNSGSVTEASLAMASRKRQQIVELRKWASEKAASFNRRVAVLSQMREELLRLSCSVLHGVNEALQAAKLENSPVFFQAKTLVQVVEKAIAQERSNESLWIINKAQLIDSLKGRLQSLKDSGALFETDATKAERDELIAALAEARRRPDGFAVSFEDLRQTGFAPIFEAKKAKLEAYAYGFVVSGAKLNTNTGGSGISSKESNLRTQLMSLIDILRECELAQNFSTDTAYTLQEYSTSYEPYYIDKSTSPQSWPSEKNSWAALQRMQVQHQASGSIETVKYALSAFDNELRGLLKDRTAINQQLLLARLKQLEQFQELSVIESMEARCVKLQQDLSTERDECQQVEGRLESLDASMTERKQAIESCHATEVDIRRRVAEAVGPRNPQQAALMQIFERNVMHRNAKPPAGSSGGDAESSDLEDEVDEAEPLQADSADVEEDVCPLGCDMAVYEAILELRDLKTTNDSSIATLHRELDELKREYTKVQALQKQHALRYKSAETAIHKFLRELQSSLNELNTIVPLRASQIRCLSNIADTWHLPDQLENALLFSFAGFAALGQQVEELERETAVVADDLKQLRRLSVMARKENKQNTQRLSSLRETFKAVELVRFGVSLTLEQVEAAAEIAGQADSRARSEPIKPAFEKDIEVMAAKQAELREQQRQYTKLKQLLQDTTKRQTDLLHRLALARESDCLLSQQLQGGKRHRNTNDDGVFARRRLNELERLKQKLSVRESELQKLQELLLRIRTKGAHVEHSMLWRRDTAFLQK